MGKSEGSSLGTSDGCSLGTWDGAVVGDVDGVIEGITLGSIEGISVGQAPIIALGFKDGDKDSLEWNLMMVSPSVITRTMGNLLSSSQMFEGKSILISSPAVDALEIDTKLKRTFVSRIAANEFWKVISSSGIPTDSVR